MPSERADTHTVQEALVGLLIAEVGTKDPRSAGEFLRLVSGAATIQSESNTLLHTAVSSARAVGATWQSIGAALGITKQAAQKRFTASDVPHPPELDPHERLLGPTILFDEMQELAIAGGYGWHSVEFAANYHRLIRSATQWEHSRVTMSPKRVRQLGADGWTVIGSSFPYTYLKRDTGTPALAEPSRERSPHTQRPVGPTPGPS